ncbi:antigen 5 like allergen Cul n 1 [Drosophila biarmipes]|uniref:antigen 5 like allergen Cul n 1 n=1 Tax=Drosophila biarmipes TaxID=125945 RepID=UPI0007E655A3|nr:antigen 5 like allergen Cul n 1 [Drosophila biarmipes]
MLGHAVLLLVLSLGIHCLAENFCRNDLCRGATHIACEYPNGGFNSSCPKDAKVIELSKDLKNGIAKAHNLVRQRWASGKANVSRIACKMATVKWDDDLAKVALLNAKTCLFRHDACRNTERFPYSGQNIYLAAIWQSAGTNIDIPPTQLLEMAVKNWADEERDVVPEDLASYKRQRKVIGHLTVMINEKSSAVGCGITTYKEGGGRKYLVACNYSFANILGKSVYSECPKAGSGCPKGLSKQYPPLCA